MPGVVNGCICGGTGVGKLAWMEGLDVEAMGVAAAYVEWVVTGGCNE